MSEGHTIVNQFWKKFIGNFSINFSKSWLVNVCLKSIYKFSIYFAQKTTFSILHLFLQNTHINLSTLHIYLIKYSFFYNFLLFSPSPPLSLSHTQSETYSITYLPHRLSLSQTKSAFLINQIIITILHFIIK